MSDYRQHVLDHYRQEAADQGLSSTSTMADTTTRAKEVASIIALLDHLGGRGRLLEVGCGNGLLLQTLKARFPQLELTGLDFSQDMVRLARERDLNGVQVVHGDVMNLDFEDGRFDLIVGERCVINLMARDHQQRALRELARVLRPGGHYVCIEAFLDGLRQLNEAREEMGLSPNQQAHHNLWFEEAWFRDQIADDFEAIDLTALPLEPPLQQNFLSSYYFMSRVVYPSITQAALKYNTHFVRFFADARPRGNYAPIQLFLLKRRG